MTGTFGPLPPPLIFFPLQHVEGEGEGPGFIAAWAPGMADGGDLASFSFFRASGAPPPSMAATHPHGAPGWSPWGPGDLEVGGGQASSAPGVVSSSSASMLCPRECSRPGLGAPGALSGVLSQFLDRS